MNNPLKIAASLLVLFAGGLPVFGQDTPGPATRKVQYSPYPGQDFPNQVLFGDTHLHTAYSTDAGLVGCTLSPDDAYRFAKGETVTASNGVPARLKRPLDFLVVTDHAENLGLSPAIAEDNETLLSTAWGKTIHGISKRGTPEAMAEAYDMWLAKLNAQDDPLAKLEGLQSSMWKRITESAENHNTPGAFTALIGFEWTLAPNGANLHRNLIFRDGKEEADQIVPVSAYDFQDPEKLWEWMQLYEEKTGGRVLAIPHNGNLSNGLMFDDVTLTGRKPLDASYAERRMRWEPLYEVTQMKGDGEAHPMLSPEDGFADFETWDKGSFGPEPKTSEMLPREYARAAYKRGLAYENATGMNPFKFGLVGSTDSHTALSTAEADNFFGKVSLLEPTTDPIRFEEVIAGRSAKDPSDRITAAMTAASGLAAVWSRENTREGIWDALSRKEVYATTGTRIRVRVFGGFDFTQDDMTRSDFAENGYAKGVPMGGDLKPSGAPRAPTFLVRALRDPDGANLDRVQMIKGWLDESGKAHERVHDIAVSDNRKIGANGRCETPVGSTVDPDQARFSNSIGATYFQAFWKDPDFEVGERAFYYVRVIEIPTPRWTTYDAKVFGISRPDNIPASIQERAYTSPIWYSP